MPKTILDVALYDATQENLAKEKGLSHVWSMCKLLGFDRTKGCRSVEDVYQFIHDLPDDVRLRIQVWSHGSHNWRMWIDDAYLDQNELIKVGRGRIKWLWGRSCDTLCGGGAALAERWAREANSDYIGHNVITNAPAVTHQGGLYAYGPRHIRQGKSFDIPAVDGDGGSHIAGKNKRTILTTTMSPPSWAWKW